MTAELARFSDPEAYDKEFNRLTDAGLSTEAARARLGDAPYEQARTEDLAAARLESVPAPTYIFVEEDRKRRDHFLKVSNGNETLARALYMAESEQRIKAYRDIGRVAVPRTPWDQL